MPQFPQVTELELESCEGDKTDWSKDGPEGRGAGLARRVVGLREEVASRVAGLREEVCTWQFVTARLPPLDWGRGYTLQMLTGDCIAGLTTALTVIPQGIGYAPLAGLPLQYGLYASLVPGFIYCLLGTTKEATIGPTAVMSIMSYSYAGGSPYKAVTLAFYTGCIEIICGLLNLGFLVQYISQPVLVAFSSAVAIQVITSQVKGLLGITGFKGRGFLKVWEGVLGNISSIQWYDTAMSVVCVAILYFLRRLKEFNWCEGPDLASNRARVTKKTKWLLSVSGNCLVMVVTSVLAWVLVSQGLDLFSLTGEVDPGLPTWQLPWNFNRNSTTEPGEPWQGPLELAQELGLGLLMCPLVAVLQHLAIAKLYARDRQMAASQEMLALGVCQAVGAFTGSMAVTAAFSRCTVNASSGVRSPFGGVITGLILYLACALLTPHLAYIPIASLSAVIVTAIFFVIDFNIGITLWRSKKADLVPYLLTLLLGIFLSVESGLIVGSLVHIAILLYSQAQPVILVTKEVTHILVSPQCSQLSFAGVELLRQRLNTAASDALPLIVDLALVYDVDYTSAKVLLAIVKGVRAKGRKLELCSVAQGVLSTLEGVQGEAVPVMASLQEAIASTTV